MTLLTALLVAVPRLLPETFRAKDVLGVFNLVMVESVALFGHIQAMTLWSAFHAGGATGRWLTGGLYLFLGGVIVYAFVLSRRIGSRERR